MNLEASIKKNLVLFLTGKLTAALGSSIYGFAIGLYILEKTGSSLNFAITLLLSILPRILLSPLAGTLSDRWNRKKIIIISDFACALWIAIVWGMFSFVTQEIWLLYVATALLSILNTFYSAAITSTIYNMVGPDYLQKAMSLNQVATSLSTILGPVLGGIFFGLFPVTIFMVINFFTFLISGIASIIIQYELFAEKKEKTKENNIFTDLKLGIYYVKNQPFLLHLIILSIWINFWFASFPVAMPYLVLTIRGMAPYQLGIIEGAFSIGMMLMAIVLSTRPEIKRKERTVLGGVILLALALTFLGLPSIQGLLQVPNSIIFPYLIAVVLLLSSFMMIINMPVLVLIQKSTPDEYRGRVNSLLETGATAMMPLGYIIFGILLEKMPVWILLCICSLSIIVLIIYHIKNKTFTPYLLKMEKADQYEVEV